MSKSYDLIIVGAGITGLGLFETASLDGVKTLLLEMGRPGRQTTGATSGLFHGGLRYLGYDAHTSLLMGRQAGLMSRQYADLVDRNVFIWPVYRGDPFGMNLVETLLETYDDLADLRRARKHVRLSAREVLELEPRLKSKGLVGGLTFDEWSVRVEGLVERLIEAGREHGGEVLKHRKVTGFVRGKRGLEAVVAEDEKGRKTEFKGRIFVNAGGPWSQQIAEMAGSAQVELSLRKGVHLVVKGRFPHALIFPMQTGRYIGLFPKKGEAWVGPTDDAFEGGAPESVRADEAERETLLEALKRVMPGLKPGRTGLAAGLRPLFGQKGLPSLFSRSHRIQDHSSEGLPNFLTVTGGKLTTFRPMAEEALQLISQKLDRPPIVGMEDGPEREDSDLPFHMGVFKKHGKTTLPFSAGLLAFGLARHGLRCAVRTSRSGMDLYRKTYGKGG